VSIVEALLLFLPAGMANLAPVLTNKIPFLNQFTAPLDLGKTYQGKRIFGANKTWRGLLSGVVAGALAGLILHILDPDLTIIVQTKLSWPALDLWFIGLLLGLGALYGDAAGSFFKRQLNIPAGDSWFPIDQIDFIIGGLLAVLPLGLFGLPQMLVILAVYFGLHLLTTYIGFKLGLKPKPI
jgi:CDP-2,3-bis-(O-geranylgeranyl)-sn-glycerol synthase